MPVNHSSESDASKPRNVPNHQVLRPSRREVLCWTVAGSAAAGLTAASMVRADDLEGVGDGEDNGYSRYCAVPRDEDQFTQAVRIEKNVLGPKILVGNMERSGFEAWLSAEEANDLRQHDDILEVLPLTADDVPVLGMRQPQFTGWLITVLLAPNSWSHKPAEDSFQSSQQLSEQWKEQFETSFVTVPHMGMVCGDLVGEEVSAPIIATLRQHPQVASLSWALPGANFNLPGGGFYCPGCGRG